jgi:hypothetical protein
VATLKGFYHWGLLLLLLQGTPLLLSEAMCLLQFNRDDSPLKFHPVIPALHQTEPISRSGMLRSRHQVWGKLWVQLMCQCRVQKGAWTATWCALLNTPVCIVRCSWPALPAVRGGLYSLGLTAPCRHSPYMADIPGEDMDQ